MKNKINNDDIFIYKKCNWKEIDELRNKYNLYKGDNGIDIVMKKNNKIIPIQCKYIKKKTLSLGNLTNFIYSINQSNIFSNGIIMTSAEKQSTKIINDEKISFIFGKEIFDEYYEKYLEIYKNEDKKIKELDDDRIKQNEKNVEKYLEKYKKEDKKIKKLDNDETKINLYDFDKNIELYKKMSIKEKIIFNAGMKYGEKITIESVCMIFGFLFNGVYKIYMWIYGWVYGKK